MSSVMLGFVFLIFLLDRPGPADQPGDGKVKVAVRGWSDLVG